MLKPSGLQNCEEDEDHLLVSVLDKSAAALRDFKANAKLESASTMQALSTVLGSGFTDEDWASEGEEVVDDDDDDDVESCSLADSELQVVTALGGYLITRLSRQKKLTCSCCRSELLSGEQNILLQERQRDVSVSLMSGSPSLNKFVLAAEKEFRSAMSEETFCVAEHIGLRLRQRILKKVPRLQCCHPEAAATIVLGLFLRVRLHHHCKLYTAHISEDRKKQRRDKKLKKLGASK